MTSTNNSNHLEKMSTRPKVRRSVRPESQDDYEPLEKKRIVFTDENGDRRSISFISREFALRLTCIPYYELSFEELSHLGNMGHSEVINQWMFNCRKFENMLSTVVNLPYFRFWSSVVHNREIYDSIQSYLVNATRPYRLHSLLKSNDTRSILSNIHCLVFKFYIRMFQSKETEANFISETHHSQLLVSNNLIDVPSMIDLIQLYGYGSNSEILRHLLKNVIDKTFEHIKEELHQVLQEVSQFFHNYENEEVEQLSEFYGTISNVTDLVFAMSKFAMISPKIIPIFREVKLVEAIVAFHSKYFPFIEDKILSFLRKKMLNESIFDFLKSQITLGQASSLLIFHRFNRINIENLLSSSDETLQYQCFESLINSLNFVATEKRFCYDFFTHFLFEKEFESLLNSKALNHQLNISDVLDIYEVSMKQSVQEYLEQKNKTDNGLAGMSLSYQPSGQPTPSVTPPERVVREIDVPDLAEKEQSIHEMFPYLGNGFIYKCLEYFDWNNERVVDAILEENLPPELRSLNQKLTKSEIEESRLKSIATDTAKFDPKSNCNMELSQIYIGKKDKTGELNRNRSEVNERTLQLAGKIEDDEEQFRESVRQMMERGKVTKKDLQTNEQFIEASELLYEDEFDDTYENEDESFDISVPNEDEPESDEEDSGEQLSGPVRPKFFNNAEKAGNFAKFNRKQLYNRKNWIRKQNNEQSSSQNQTSRNSQVARNSNPVQTVSQQSEVKKPKNNQNRESVTDQHGTRAPPNNGSRNRPSNHGTDAPPPPPNEPNHTSKPMNRGARGNQGPRRHFQGHMGARGGRGPR